jgi:hypothetical protein
MKSFACAMSRSVAPMPCVPALPQRVNALAGLVFDIIGKQTKPRDE